MKKLVSSAADFFLVTPAATAGVFVVRANGCLATKAVQPENKMSKKIPEAEFSYPNPANDKLHLQLPENTDGTVLINIIDLNGRVVAAPAQDQEQQGNRFTATIDVSKFSSGIYVYRITAGNDNYQGRFIKE